MAGEAGHEPPRLNPDERGSAALERLSTFSDAVFAIAMTLLVLDIPRPDPEQDVGAFLTTIDGKFVAFVISFWVIAVFWSGHHRLMRYLDRYDQGVLALNLLLLFCISFIPYPSALLGDRPDDVDTVVFYASVIAIAGFASGLLTWYVVIHRGFVREVARAIAWYHVSRGWVVPVVFLASIPVAIVIGPAAAFLMWPVTWVLQPLAKIVAQRRAVSAA